MATSARSRTATAPSSGESFSSDPIEEEMTDDEKQSEDETESDARLDERRRQPPPATDQEAEAIDRDTERAAEGPITKSSSLDSRS